MCIRDRLDLMVIFIAGVLAKRNENGRKPVAVRIYSAVFSLITILLMVCAGASELSMAQWASAFAESALGLTKSVGDIACLLYTSYFCRRFKKLYGVTPIYYRNHCHSAE